MKHGTYSAYNDHKCRCDDCRKANADYHKSLVEYLNACMIAGTKNPPHGNTSTYSNYGCRCEPCKTAQSYKNKANALRRKARAAAMKTEV